MTTIAEHNELTLANPDAHYQKVRLLEPTTLGYIHLAAAVEPQMPPLSFILPTGRDKTALLVRSQELAQRLEQETAVERVTLFDAIVIPPVARFSPYLRERGEAIHTPRFDVVVLIETTTPAVIDDVQALPTYRTLVDTLHSAASDMHIMTARNARRVGDVDEDRQGLFLFNYFVGDDPEVTLQLWDYLADWYVKETGMDNSILLAPLNGEQSDYTLINHARWDESLLRFFWQQFGTPSFRHYVLGNLEANRVGAMPLLYRLVTDQPARQWSPWVITLGAAALSMGLVWWRRRSQVIV
ncbi:MAG: hypothetical protein R3C14_26710 [Caldilineaceae bacterium]